MGSRRVCVFGDVMLDQYVHCTPRRISPEAPVIIAREENHTCVPGGAANVAANITEGMGLETRLVGVVGQDDACIVLKESLRQHGIVPNYLLVQESNWTTIQKLRFVDHQHHQMFRLDRELTQAELTPTVEQMLCGVLFEQIDACQTLVVSDYAKGTCAPRLLYKALEYAASKERFIVVNGKPGRLKLYDRASLIIMNRAEAYETYTHELGRQECDPVEEVAKSLAAAIHGESLVTLGAEGMIYARYPNYWHVPAVPVAVANVSGAGDTVTATIAAHGCCDLDVIHIAARNAAEVVSQHGTSILSRREVG